VRAQAKMEERPPAVEELEGRLTLVGSACWLAVRPFSDLPRSPSAKKYPALSSPDIVPARIAFFQEPIRLLFRQVLPRNAPATMSGIMIGI